MPGHALIYSVNQKIIVKCCAGDSAVNKTELMPCWHKDREQMRDIMPESKYFREKQNRVARRW